MRGSDIMETFIYNIKLFASRKNFILSIFITVLIAIVNIFFIKSQQPVSNSLIEPMTSFEYFVNVQGGASGFLCLVLPLSVTFATGDIFIKEKKSSIMSYSLMRTNIDTYIKKRLFYIGATSFLFVFLVQCLIFFITLILFPANDPGLNHDTVIYGKDLFLSNPWVYCFIVLITSSLMAFWFSSFSIFIDIFINNLYVSLMMPYILLIGISQTLMAFPMLIGLKGRLIYNMAPLVLNGDYFTVNFDLWIPPLYGLLMSIISFYVSVYFFKKRFHKEKIIM